MFFLLPETKFVRSQDESSRCQSIQYNLLELRLILLAEGIPAVPLRPGQRRPDIDYETYPARSWKEDLKLYEGKPDWNDGLVAIWDCIRTFFYPHLFFITMLNSAVIAVALAAGYTIAPQLLTAPWSWPFYHLGFCLFPIIVAAGASFVVSGWGADLVANWFAKKHGRRSPEVQLLNLIIPCVVGLIGCLLFGFAGDDPAKYHWMVFLLGLAMIAFAFLATNTIGIVYVLESAPELTGPSLVNIASFRCIIAFVLSFRVSEWVAELGYLKTFVMYAGILGAFILFIPVVYIWGGGWRKRFPASPKGRANRRS